MTLLAEHHTNKNVVDGCFANLIKSWRYTTGRDWPSFIGCGPSPLVSRPPSVLSCSSLLSHGLSRYFSRSDLGRFHWVTHFVLSTAILTIWPAHRSLCYLYNLTIVATMISFWFYPMFSHNKQVVSILVILLICYMILDLFWSNTFSIRSSNLTFTNSGFICQKVAKLNTGYAFNIALL